MLYDLSKQNEQRNAEFYFAKLIKEYTFKPFPYTPLREKMSFK